MNNYNRNPSQGSKVLSIFFIISIFFGLVFAAGAYYVYYSSETMIPLILGFVIGACFPMIFTILILILTNPTSSIETFSSDGRTQ